MLSTQIIAALIPALIMAAPAIKLLRLAQEEAKSQYWAIATFFLSFVFFLPLRSIGEAEMVEPKVAVVLNLSGYIIAAVGFSGLYVFIWQTFRPESATARRCAKLGIGIAILGPVLMLVTTAMGSGMAAGSIPPALSLIPMIWLFTESTLYYRRMRRRARIGIADPVLANRFMLWAVWSGSYALLLLTFVLVRVRLMMMAVEVGSDQIDTVIQTLQALGMVTFLIVAVSVWLSFFPPSVYVRFLQREH